MKIFKKALKILGLVILTLFIGVYILFYRVTMPKSDEKVLAEFKELGVTPLISKDKFKSFDYRKVSVIKDTALPTVVFVHGAIGSVLDFKQYMTDSLLLEKANMIIYDRIGYSYDDKNDVQESIAFEVEMLESITEELVPERTILVGYSYGGPIALATKKEYKKVILLAPAVYSKVEPMPWMLNLYKWKLTRWMVPPVWKQASREKMTHRQDLEKFEKKWSITPNSVISIHGDEDWIVPYSNSEYLLDQFPKDQFEMVTVKGAGHGLVWSNFEEIKQQFLNLFN
ncbi:MAG: alpha/beta hydrolase [Flavobacteriaceae bacterium]